MNKPIKAREPFVFYSRFNLQELTGLKAGNLESLLDLISTVPGSSIYHHTHRFMEKHDYLLPEPPNDFAVWIGDVLGDRTLQEKLAGIDVLQFTTIKDLRLALVEAIDSHLSAYPRARKRFAEKDDEFHFIKSVSVIVPTPYSAESLEAFIKGLKEVSTSSIYFHMFEARLRLERQTNDFSWWLESALLLKTLGEKISSLDPYSFTLSGLRRKIIGILEECAGDDR